MPLGKYERRVPLRPHLRGFAFRQLGRPTRAPLRRGAPHHLQPATGGGVVALPLRSVHLLEGTRRGPALPSRRCEQLTGYSKDCALSRLGRAGRRHKRGTAGKGQSNNCETTAADSLREQWTRLHSNHIAIT